MHTKTDKEPETYGTVKNIAYYLKNSADIGKYKKAVANKYEHISLLC